MDHRVSIAEQDFDALSESSFDFGHFNDLDSDQDEPELDEHSLDPFTAAQKEQVAAKSAHGEGEAEVDDQFRFTQKLLTNARTLKELRDSGIAELEIALEDEEENADLGLLTPGRLSSPPSPLQSQSALRTPKVLIETQYERQNHTQLSSFDKYEDSGIGGINAPGSPQYQFSKVSYDMLAALPGEDLIQGRYESFPVELLRYYTFEQCRLILEQTRVYSDLILGDRSDVVCLHRIWDAHSLSSAPVLSVIGANGDKILLKDHHDSPCTVIGLLPTRPDRANLSADAVCLNDFHFDHVATKQEVQTPEGSPLRERANVQHFSDSFFSSQVTGINADQMNHVAKPKYDAAPSKAPIAPIGNSKLSCSSVLIINKYKFMNLKDWTMQVEARKRSKAATQQLYEGEPQINLTPTQATTQTDYSDQFENYLDMDDFPIEEVMPRH